MDWSSGQPELPSGSLILFRISSSSSSVRGRQFKVVKRLGCGQSFVYEGVEVTDSGTGLAEDGEAMATERPADVVDEPVDEPVDKLVDEPVDGPVDEPVAVTPSKRQLLSVDRTPSGRVAKKSRTTAPSPPKTGKKRAVPLTASGPSIERIAPSLSPGPSMARLSPNPSLIAPAVSPTNGHPD